MRTRNDGMYEGIFCTLSPKAAFVLKCVHKMEKKTSNGFNGVSIPEIRAARYRKYVIYVFLIPYMYGMS